MVAILVNFSEGACFATLNLIFHKIEGEKSQISMKIILKLEEAAVFALCWYGTLYLGFSWWTFPAWLLVPDVSMIGYAVNTRIGAALYNLVHHRAVAALAFVAGLAGGGEQWLFAGLLLAGHISMDRIFGYGLKFSDDFKHTHLGWIGKAEQKDLPA